jgi:hypothetical protein
VTPTWAVVVAAVASGLLVGLLTTLIRVSYEQKAELRAHMLDAADQFLAGVVSALRHARNAAGDIKKENVPLLEGDWFRDEIRAYLDAANDAVDDALAKSARVHLLFGDRSAAGISATGAVEHLRNLNSALEHLPDSVRDRETMSRYSLNFDRARQQQETFARAARAALPEMWWTRLWNALRG